VAGTRPRRRAAAGKRNFLIYEGIRSWTSLDPENLSRNTKSRAIRVREGGDGHHIVSPPHPTEDRHNIWANGPLRVESPTLLSMVAWILSHCKVDSCPGQFIDPGHSILSFWPYNSHVDRGRRIQKESLLEALTLEFGSKFEAFNIYYIVIKQPFTLEPYDLPKYYSLRAHPLEIIPSVMIR
jgi:hypothetical protein